MKGIEPLTFPLPRECATTAPHQRIKRDTFLTNALPSELITHVRNVGIEPTTYRLIEFAVCIPKLARLEGFEPPTPSFVAKYSSPLSYRRILAEGTGFEPVITISKTGALGQTKLTPNNLVYFFLNVIVWHF
jgi:hypothetical protein